MQRVMTRAVGMSQATPTRRKRASLEGARRPLFIFTDDGKTNKSIVMPDPNFLQVGRTSQTAMTSHSSMRRRWRSWIRQIDEQITLPAYLDKKMFEAYVGMVQANKHIQTPGNFHHWVFRNYAHSLAIRIRKLVDTDNRAISLRGLLGAIVNSPQALTRRAFLGRYPVHFRDYAAQNWLKYCGGSNRDFLPSGVAHHDLRTVDRIAKQVVMIVNKEIVHHERGRRFRTLHMDEAHAALDALLQILAKYGDICGRPVPCPYAIHDASDWRRIFRRRWLEESVGAQHGAAADDIRRTQRP